MSVVRLTAADLDRLADESARPIAAAFRYAEWQWGGLLNDHIPGVTEIRGTIRRLLEECPNRRDLGTGRIHVSRWVDGGREFADVRLEIAEIESG